MTCYRRGAFVNILSPAKEDWRASYRRIERFPGRHHVELWIEHVPSREEIGTLRDLLHGTEVIVHGPFIHLSLCTRLTELADLSIRRCELVIDVATRINAKVVTLHAGTYEVFEQHQSALDRLVRRIERFTSVQSPVVTLENMPVRSSGTTRECLGHLDDLRRLVAMIPQVHLTLDIGHCLQNGDNHLAFLRQYHDQIRNIHLHDGRESGRGHLRLGSGELDLPKLLWTLESVRYPGFVTLETIRDEDTDSSWATWLKTEVSALT
jgi:sugar phosphate isomerase/epimerase